MIMDIESRIWQTFQVYVIAAILFLHIICIINEVILITFCFIVHHFLVITHVNNRFYASCS